MSEIFTELVKSASLNVATRQHLLVPTEKAAKFDPTQFADPVTALAAAVQISSPVVLPDGTKLTQSGSTRKRSYTVAPSPKVKAMYRDQAKQAKSDLKDITSQKKDLLRQATGKDATPVGAQLAQLEEQEQQLLQMVQQTDITPQDYPDPTSAAQAAMQLVDPDGDGDDDAADGNDDDTAASAAPADPFSQAQAAVQAA